MLLGSSMRNGTVSVVRWETAGAMTDMIRVVVGIVYLTGATLMLALILARVFNIVLDLIIVQEQINSLKTGVRRVYNLLLFRILRLCLSCFFAAGSIVWLQTVNYHTARRKIRHRYVKHRSNHRAQIRSAKVEGDIGG